MFSTLLMLATGALYNALTLLLGKNNRICENLLMAEIGQIEKVIHNKYNVSILLDYSPLMKAIHLKIIIVSETERNKGVGSKTMSIVKTFAGKRNLPVFLLPSQIDTTPLETLITFYTKQNFVPLEEDTSYYVWNK